MKRFHRILDLYDLIEMRLASWMEAHGYTLLRIAMGVIFIWFGALKPLGLSPAAELVAQTTWWIPIPHFLYVLGAWEVAIGICFLSPRLVRYALILLFMHMPGTMLPLIMLPDASYVQFPYGLTLEGQYIIKNLVLIASAIVLGGKLRHRMRGALSKAPDGFHTLLRRGRWGVAEVGECLAVEGEPMTEIFFVRSGAGVIRIGERQVGKLRRNQLIGEMSFLTDAEAAATVEVTEAVEYIAWSKQELRTLFDDRQSLQHAMQATINLDLCDKLRHANENGQLVPEPA